jgi:leader peptidase (prepilin peptidase)/N-methyltransferase
VDYLLAIFLGAIFGSFANVCIYRLPNNKKISKGRSFCPKCKKKINWFDNIPLISFLVLQYFLVEAVSAFLFIFIYYYFGISIDTLLLIILSMFLLVIFFIDLKHYIIPNELTFPLMGIGFLKSFDPNLNTAIFPNFINSLIGGVLGYLLIWSIIFFYKQIRNKEGMGLGDAKLLAVTGFWFGWVSVPFVIFSSSIIALISVIPSLMTKKRKMTSQIPFGPYIVIATVIYFYFSDYLKGFIF